MQKCQVCEDLATTSLTIHNARYYSCDKCIHKTFENTKKAKKQWVFTYTDELENFYRIASSIQLTFNEARKLSNKYRLELQGLFKINITPVSIIHKTSNDL